jgi:hypothetical protein
MRYLNKIIFINSAAVNYAEINVDGNVHFIGTQGVGKSTALRAILFFYNADKLRLGIEKGKRSFDDYYFPYGNSYIIYEVVRETGTFCVLAFKSQGRVAFRFIEGAYDKGNFIGNDHKALTWEQIRNTFPGHGFYSRKIDRYDEYRDILYGNNKGLPAEFRKYALIESRQYKNLPRTIQNVFLNSKLEAEFIKQTIIMSLNEEDVMIDLDQYAFHLRDFEAQLADISKWSTKNRAGEIAVQVLANRIAKHYTEIRYVEKEKVYLAALLMAAHKYVEASYPVALKLLENEQNKLDAAQKKVAEADGKFQQKKVKICNEINLLEAKLKDARRKWEDYERLNINSIILRVGKKQEWEQKKAALLEEQGLLSARFKEITNKFEALIKQVQIQLEDFINARNTEKNNLQGSFYERKDQLSKQYEHIIAEIEQEHKEVMISAGKAIAEKTALVHALEMRKRETEWKKYFDKEIGDAQQVIRQADQVLHGAGVDIMGWKKQIEAIQKQWDWDVVKSEADAGNQIAKINDSIGASHKKIQHIDVLLSNNRHSFYAWLHENRPGWEQTIGKVIDEEHTLFHTNLSPRISGQDTSTFFGVELDLSEIGKKVKSLSDYEAEKNCLAAGIDQLKAQMAGLEHKKVQDQEKLRKKYQPQILGLKEQISRREYESHKAGSDKEQALVKLAEWRTKAVETQNQDIQAIKSEMEKAENEKQLAENRLIKLEKNIMAQIDAKKKERENKINQAQTELREKLQELDREMEAKKQEANLRKLQIQEQSKKALHQEGADTDRLLIIEQELQNIKKELDFIEDNRDKVADFNKDKRELFDWTDTFKAEKKVNETRLLAEQQKHELVKARLVEAVGKLQAALAHLKAASKQMEEDLHEFERFQHTAVFLSLNPESLAAAEAIQPPKRLTELIGDLNDKSFSLTNRLTAIRSDISKFLSNFSPTNIFGFRTSLIENQDYLDFAENLKEFLEEDKIGEYERRTNERFASLIRQIGKETTELVSKENEIQKVINDINRDFEERNFAGVIKSINLRLSESANKIVVLLQEIRAFNNDYATTLGAANLFSTDDTESNNKKAVGLLKSFAGEITSTKQQEVNLSDTFELEFRIMENDNDSGWVEKLANVGSEGTDILVKAMINIMLLNVFKESASKRFRDFRLHCMMDEIGKLHPNNVKGILKFANDRNILLINSSPTSYNAMDYRYTYLLTKDNRNVTTVKKLVKNNPVYEVA